MSLLTRLRGYAKPEQAASGLIGLDCARDSLHMVQFDRAHELGLNLRAKVSLPYPEPLPALLKRPAVLSAAVKEASKNQGFAGRRMASTLPANQTSIVSLGYRLSSGQNEARIITDLMAERLEGSLADWVIDYLPIRQSTAEERLALVAYARREDAIAYLELWRKCGFEIASLEIRPLAIKRLVYLISGATLWNALSINFGRDRSFLTLFSSKRILYDQSVDFGESRLLSHLVEALDLPVELLRSMVYSQDISGSSNQLVASAIDLNVDMNDVFQEIIRPAFLPLIEAVDRALIFAASETRGEPVREVFLLGSIARWAGIAKLMQKMLHLPVRVIPDPLVSMRSDDADEYDRGEPEIAVATGLALKNLLPHV